MLRVCQQLASTLQYLERSLSGPPTIALASDLPMRTIKFCSVVNSSSGILWRLSVMKQWIHGMWRSALRRPSPAINKRHISAVTYNRRKSKC